MTMDMGAPRDGLKLDASSVLSLPLRTHPGAEPSKSPVWVLLGRRRGDNNQLLATARSLGLPFEVVQLQFKRGSGLPNILTGCSLARLRDPTVLPGGVPRLVLSIGRRSVPIARWIRQESGGYTKTVHFGRPWGRSAWFDLVVTTPQYRLRQAPNVLCNSLPFVPVPENTSLSPLQGGRWADLPRPWTVILMGGNSKPYVLDSTAVQGLIVRGNQRVAERGGSLLVVPSPRTPPSCLSAVLPQIRGPSYVYEPGKDENPYRALLQTADYFLVTSDSAMMVAEVLVAAKPLEVLELPRRPDWRYAATEWWERTVAPHPRLSRIFDTLREVGLVHSTRDLREYYRRLEAAGAFATLGTAALLAESEQHQTISRILDLL